MPTPLIPANATVGTSSTEIVAENANRKGLIINNMSASNIFLGFGAPAVWLKGVVLQPGQSYSADPNNLATTAVNGIADTASSMVTVQEYV